ncbi:MAG: type II toxin-antitoxin system PemK/MazF family toxin [Phormidesmis sp.]
MERRLEKGDVVLAALPEQVPSMHEQQGTRPAVVVGVLPGRTRYQLAMIAPLTTKSGKWFDLNPIVYPVLAAGMGDLKQDSIVLLDQVRAIDGRRLLQYIGKLTEEEYAPIQSGVSRIFT